MRGSLYLCSCLPVSIFLLSDTQSFKFVINYAEKKKEKKKESITHTLPCKYNVINATEEV